MRGYRTVMIAVSFLALGRLCAAETLVEASERKQKEPRSGQGRAFTNEDLEKGKPTPRPTPKDGADGAAAPATPAPTAVPPADPTPDPGPDLASQRQQWSQRANAIRSEISSAQAAVAAAQEKLDAATSPFHPLTPRGYGNPEVPALRGAVDQAKAALAEAEKKLPALQEEARRSGIPSSWLEEDR